MPRYIAFLRAINVGGHTVKMDRLRQHFESLGFANVETFIASGNVVFETTAMDTAALETRIAAALHAALGYEVATFIRTEAELSGIAEYQPFPPAASRCGPGAQRRFSGGRARCRVRAEAHGVKNGD